MRLRNWSMVFAFVLCSTGAAAQTPAPTGDYVWAAACKECHTGHYTAWEATKHARAINRLVGSDRESNCVACHVTGSAQLVAGGVNANVQCEACHGPAGEHVRKARAGSDLAGTVVRRPDEASCVRCHNDKSPHFRFFMYKALVGMVHKVAP